jgi:glycosidase
MRIASFVKTVHVALRQRVFIGSLLCTALLTAGNVDAATEALKLHVPSPDWRDQIIYLAMIDRFDDGDPSNNDQGAGEFDPKDPSRFSGGDLAGVTRRLDYLKQLGVTAVWLTPPVANQWWDARVNYGGYHGYWAENFKRIDAHFGDLDAYQRLSHELHSRGMYLVHDVVVNHVGNFFSYPDGWDANDPTRHYVANTDARPRTAPTQWPFTLNDPRRDEDRKAAIYHWTPRISDFADAAQQYEYQLADLDDLNTDNPVVRRALRDSYGFWIREAGVDAFRVDTAFYVPPDFFRDFLHADDDDAPGVIAVAKATGRSNFHVFGEGFALDKPFEDTQARRIETYQQGKDRLSGMINFPLYGSTLDVFARGRPPAVLAHRIRSAMQLHANPYLMPTFVDNHDVERFLAGGSAAALRQSLLMIMTLPGIPTIYYGTEQDFTEQRGAMFESGFGSGGRERFDTSTPTFRFIKRITQLRREHPVLSRGVPAIIEANAAAPGAFGYTMKHEDEAAVVFFNTAETESLTASVATGLPPGTRLQPIFSLQDHARPVTVGADGSLTLMLQGRSGEVWLVQEQTDRTESSAARIDIAPLDSTVVAGDLKVTGASKDVDEFLLVVDGDLRSALRVQPDATGKWQATIDTASLIDPAVEHQLVAWAQTKSAVSQRQTFRVKRDWSIAIEQADPTGDDHGRSRKLVYPTDAAWRERRPLDLLGARVFTSGGSLRVEMQLHDLFSLWNAPNGFDHVAVTAFVELPGRAGGTWVMPLQSGELPGDMRWHYRLRLGGWTNALFASDGASATNEGRSVAPAAAFEIDAKQHTITFTLPAAALDSPKSLAGARIHLTTWDYDGRYRELKPQASGFEFGGGVANDALVLDEMTIEVPAK